jgi:hypothetical protein
MAKKKIDLRETFINTIMKNKYGTDHLKYQDSNRAFLESLTIDELQKMSIEDDEFPDDINDGFNDDEDTISIPDDEL